jgi:chloride channel 3/4/5
VTATITPHCNIEGGPPQQLAQLQKYEPAPYRAMNSRSSSVSVLPSPQVFQRPSFSSRLSSAISNAEQGEVDHTSHAADRQINEEIDEIKRYEVRFMMRSLGVGRPS